VIAEAYPHIIVEIYVMDITVEANVTDFYEKVIAKFGRVDFAANIAGYAQKSARITETSTAEYDKSYVINQRGVSSFRRLISSLLLGT
jgi:NAD(P)-dependent dehydrogenase (short-subunit alcohol dehydrogenase family)